MNGQTTNGTASFYRKKMDLYWKKKQENILKAQLGIPKDAVVKDDEAAKSKAQLGISEYGEKEDDNGSEEETAAMKVKKSRKRKVEVEDIDESEQEDAPETKPKKSKKRKAEWKMLK